jgi:hypothetical protein
MLSHDASSVAAAIPWEDEARSLRARGMSFGAIRRELGVTEHAVRKLLEPGYMDNRRADARRYHSEGAKETRARPASAGRGREKTSLPLLWSLAPPAIAGRPVPGLMDAATDFAQDRINRAEFSRRLDRIYAPRRTPCLKPTKFG